MAGAGGNHAVTIGAAANPHEWKNQTPAKEGHYSTEA